MRSTDCTLTDAGAELLLEDGRGFGHGLGMCQWGAEGQARAGRRAGKVLLHYYPGAQLVRAY
jgi:stage II sporulation protein D